MPEHFEDQAAIAFAELTRLRGWNMTRTFAFIEGAKWARQEAIKAAQSPWDVSITSNDVTSVANGLRDLHLVSDPVEAEIRQAVIDVIDRISGHGDENGNALNDNAEG